MTYDLLIKGGRVVDPASDRDGDFDIGIADGRVAAVERHIPDSAAAGTLDAHGHIVTPGLVDLHTHVYHSVTYWGIHADPVAARTGVTTWLDAGSAGAYNFGGFREFVAQPARARLFALMNISAIGLTAPTWELANLNYCDVELCAKLVQLNRDLVRGVKARVDRNTIGANGLEPLKLARRAAEECGLPLMVHIGHGPPPVEDVIALMRPGDILTHCCTGHSMRLVDDQGRLLDTVRRAWDAGLVLDIGHGAGSFSFDVAEAMVNAGHRPDVISSDIHQLSALGPMFDLPTCLSKFLALGLSLGDVVRAATVQPAGAMGMAEDIGSLRPGARADVALFKLVEGRFTFYDVFMRAREGRQLLVNALTMVGGQVLPRSPEPPSAPWIEPSADQRLLLERGHTPAAFAGPHAA